MSEMLSPLDDPLDYDVVALRQALWDVYEILGFDTDGDKTPAAQMRLRKIVIDAAREFRKDYDEALDEIRDPVCHLVTARGQLNRSTDCCGKPLAELHKDDYTTRDMRSTTCAHIFRSNHPAAGGPRERS